MPRSDVAIAGALHEEAEPADSVEKIRDAAEFLLASSLCSDAKYSWVLPLVRPILTNAEEHPNVASYLESIFSPEESSSSSESIETTAPPSATADSSESISPQTPVRMRQLTEISSVQNIGLLSTKQSIPLKDGLNVFYGKNGAGKSSLYLALCKVLGCDKVVLPNCNQSNDTDQAVVVKALTENGDTIDLSWSSEPAPIPPPAEVRIYDSYIHNFIVEQDQVNEFRLAHLRSECFDLLNEKYAAVDSWLQSTQNTAIQRHSALELLLVEKIEEFHAIKATLNYDSLASLTFSQEEAKELTEMQDRESLLKKEDPQVRKTSIVNTRAKLRALLGAFGTATVVSEPGEAGKTKPQTTWSCTVNASTLTDTNSLIQKLSELTEKRKEKQDRLLQGHLPADWMKNELWFPFIQASVEFAESLSDSEKSEYKENSCLYCLQPLTSDTAKKLIGAYFDLDSDTRDQVKSTKAEIDKCVIFFKAAFDQIQEIDSLENSLTGDYQLLQKELSSKPKCQSVIELLSKTLDAIKSVKVVEVNPPEFASIELFFERYVALDSELSTFIEVLETASNTRAEDLSKASAAIKPLRRKKQIIDNKEIVREFVRLSELLNRMKDALTTLKQAKQRTSTLATEFSREAPLQLFQKALQEEYSRFTFIPSQAFKITTRTGDQKNHRVYRLADHKLAEILSEGERRIHSLADFFAQSRLSQFKGVFIFDDPVNSLDEENIECLENRIFELVADGNQVIVFTHNLLFLNGLIKTDKDDLTRISRLEASVQIEPGLKIGSVKDHQKAWDEIKKRKEGFEKRESNTISEFEIADVYCLISRCLEFFVERELLCDVVSRYRPNIRMDSITKIAKADFSKLEILEKIYKQTSRKGTRHAPGLGTPAPTYDALKTILVGFETNFPRPTR